jgi:hypothetical protein
MNLVTPKAEVKQELLFNKPTSAECLSLHVILMSHIQLSIIQLNEVTPKLKTTILHLFRL